MRSCQVLLLAWLTEECFFCYNITPILSYTTEMATALVTRHHFNVLLFSSAQSCHKSANCAAVVARQYFNLPQCRIYLHVATAQKKEKLFPTKTLDKVTRERMRPTQACLSCNAHLRVNKNNQLRMQERYPMDVISGIVDDWACVCPKSTANPSSNCHRSALKPTFGIIGMNLICIQFILMIKSYCSFGAYKRSTRKMKSHEE